MTFNTRRCSLNPFKQHAWDQGFRNGYQDYSDKNYTRRVRFVRLITLNLSTL